jgi:hypothetical protein
MIIPQVDYNVYFVILFLFFALFYFRGKIIIDLPSKFSYALLVLLVSFLYLRNFLSDGLNLIDFKELIKLFPIFFCLFFIPRNTITLRNLTNAAILFLVIDSTISCCQFFKINSSSVFVTIEQVFNKASHVERSMGVYSRRSLGLSSGPIDHGSILTLLFAFFLGHYCLSEKNIVRHYFVLLLIVFTILISQSKTAILSIFILLVIFTIGSLFSKKILIRMLFLAIPKSILISFMLFSFLDNFKQIERLISIVDFGFLHIDSFEKRLNKWSHQLDIAHSHPLMNIIGVGRYKLGVFGNVFDNDYVYLYVVHGISFCVIIASIIIFYLFNTLVVWNTSNLTRKLFFIVIISGLIFSISGSFFTSPRNTTFLSLLIVCLLSKNHDSRYKGTVICHGQS